MYCPQAADRRNLRGSLLGFLDWFGHGEFCVLLVVVGNCFDGLVVTWIVVEIELISWRSRLKEKINVRCKVTCTYPLSFPPVYFHCYLGVYCGLLGCRVDASRPYGALVFINTGIGDGLGEGRLFGRLSFSDNSDFNSYRSLSLIHMTLIAAPQLTINLLLSCYRDGFKFSGLELVPLIISIKEP